jgi:D-mannonate dehydratase
MEGESNEHPRYSIMGKVLAVGYMKGVLHGLRIPFAQN